MQHQNDESMTIKQLFLTGGTGFFGKSLLRYWIQQSTQGKSVPAVTLMSRSPDAFLASYPEFVGLPWLTLVKGDVTMPKTFPTELNCSHILHAATDSTNGPMLTPLERFNQIVDGTRNVLDFAHRVGATRFLLTSSGGVYGPQPEKMERIPEDYNGMPDPLQPSHAYSVAKRTAEHLCALYGEAFGIEILVARCFAFVGPDLPLDAHFAIGNFIADAVAGRQITIKGDGLPIRSYLDQSDLATWLLTILEHGQSGRAYNVGSDQAITLLELANMVAETVHPKVPVQVLGSGIDAGNFRRRYVPDITRASKELGLTVSVPLHEAIKRAVMAAREAD